MKFYIASSLKNAGQVRELSHLLKCAGWEHTYDWTIHLEKDIDGTVLKAIGEKELEGVKQADIVIILTPQGRGTHIELGIAIALGKQVYLCHRDASYFQFDGNTCTFYWLPQVKRLVGDTKDIARELLQLS